MKFVQLLLTKLSLDVVCNGYLLELSLIVRIVIGLAVFSLLKY